MAIGVRKLQQLNLDSEKGIGMNRTREGRSRVLPPSQHLGLGRNLTAGVREEWGRVSEQW